MNINRWKIASSLILLLGIFIIPGFTIQKITTHPPEQQKEMFLYAKAISDGIKINTDDQKFKSDLIIAEYTRKLADYTRYLAVFTFILAFSTIGLWIATIKGGKISEQALVAGERAFVFPVSLFSEWNQDPNTLDYMWRFRVQWTNSGNTPTKNLKVYSESLLLTSPLPLDFDFSNENLSNIVNGLLAPKQTLSGPPSPAFSDLPISPHDIIAIQAGKKFLYIWGWSKYYDVFPKTRPRITRFCWLVS